MALRSRYRGGQVPRRKRRGRERIGEEKVERKKRGGERRTRDGEEKNKRVEEKIMRGESSRKE